MTRHDLKTFSWLAPASALAMLWWTFHVNRCLDDLLANLWREWFPSSCHAEPRFCGPVACDYWPSNLEQAVNIGIGVALCLVAGLLGAWCFQERPVRRTALIMAVAMAVSSVVDSIPAMADYFKYPRFWDRDLWLLFLGYHLAVVTVAALLSALAARLGQRRRARD